MLPVCTMRCTQYKFPSIYALYSFPCRTLQSFDITTRTALEFLAFEATAGLHVGCIYTGFAAHGSCYARADWPLNFGTVSMCMTLHLCKSHVCSSSFLSALCHIDKVLCWLSPSWCLLLICLVIRNGTIWLVQQL